MNGIQPPCKAVCMSMQLDLPRRRSHFYVTTKKYLYMLLGAPWRRKTSTFPSNSLSHTQYAQTWREGEGKKVQNQVALQHEADLAHIMGIYESKLHCRKSTVISISTPQVSYRPPLSGCQLRPAGCHAHDVTQSSLTLFSLHFAEVRECGHHHRDDKDVLTLELEFRFFQPEHAPYWWFCLTLSPFFFPPCIFIPSISRWK